MRLTKTTEIYEVDTELEVENLIEAIKNDLNGEGYEVTNYSSTKKIKKDEEWFVVKVTKVW